MSKSVGIIGASGFIGTHLAAKFEVLGWQVIRISRVPRRVKNEQWSLLTVETLKGIDVLVNLAGERIDKRWSVSNKKKFYDSRVVLTENIASMLMQLDEQERPSVWLNASAIGIYGDRGDEWIEENTPVGKGYLAELCEAWEAAAHAVPLEGVRIVHPRVGVVLGEGSAAWEKMNGVFKLGLGGKLGNGAQWFPWIHIDDLVNAFVKLSVSKTVSGACNIVAPHPVRNSEFTKELAAVHKKPSFCAAPAFMLRLILGEFATAMLASHRIEPACLDELGLVWKFPTVKSALLDLVDTKNENL